MRNYLDFIKNKDDICDIEWTHDEKQEGFNDGFSDDYVFEPEKKVSKDVEIVSPKMHATGNPLFLILISIFMLFPIFKR